MTLQTVPQATALLSIDVRQESSQLPWELLYIQYSQKHRIYVLGYQEEDRAEDHA
jgi:hypothetical protein